MKKTNIRFHRAIKKYGADNFSFSVLYEFDVYSDALKKEVELISTLNPAYNTTAGGQGVVGFKMPREIVDRLAAGKRGSIGYWRGKKRSLETIEKFRAAKLAKPTRFWSGKRRDAVTIEKIRKTKTGIPRKGETPLMLATAAENMRRAARARRKPVRCITDGMIFDSCRAAADHYGFHPTSVNPVVGKPTRSIHGLKFELAQAVI